ncbi:hypothetical protein [sulfur-oxidizing endosymbiont of Gigantopelta aegis]|uniref:hypothetical protein n=1 Tax=sulfur-oxidizing endosymbiont of Gigantopelta aegis TaxID=2794934 RepID=UPI0018DB776D|nr:hypothetical protein [sulfur-oxidizing endosymbiont of Gigantopelta aegis]
MCVRLSIATLIVSWYGLQLVLIEIEDAGIAFATIPTWLTVIIIPLSFFIIFIRYLSMALLLFIGYEVDDNAIQ